jgi:hypothetical protein
MGWKGDIAALLREESDRCTRNHGICARAAAELDRLREALVELAKPSTSQDPELQARIKFAAKVVHVSSPSG